MLEHQELTSILDNINRELNEAVKSEDYETIELLTKEARYFHEKIKELRKKKLKKIYDD